MGTRDHCCARMSRGMVRALALVLALALASSSPASSDLWHARRRIAAPPAFASPPATQTVGLGRGRRPFVNKQVCSMEASAATAAASKRSKNDLKWEARFTELKKYKDELGDCNVPLRGGRLGTWVINQRALYKRGELSQERIQRLERLGFTWNPLEEDWETRFSELEKYKEELGDCNVPTQGNRLGEWATNQRASYKRGELSEDRIARLETIGFAWDPMAEEWDACFSELIQYKKEQGDCNVPRHKSSLGMWVSNQRASYKRGKLPVERIRRLESVGFEWVLREHPGPGPNDELWKTRYIDLVHYLMEHGDCNVSQKRGPLGSWVSRQRTCYKDGRLARYRKEYLESIGFVWELNRSGNRHGRCLPERQKPNLKAIARLIREEEGTPVAEALETYLGGLSTN